METIAARVQSTIVDLAILAVICILAIRGKIGTIETTAALGAIIAGRSWVGSRKASADHAYALGAASTDRMRAVREPVRPKKQSDDDDGGPSATPRSSSSFVELPPLNPPHPNAVRKRDQRVEPEDATDDERPSRPVRTRMVRSSPILELWHALRARKQPNHA